MIDVQLRGFVFAGQIVLGPVIYRPAAGYLDALSIEERAKVWGDFGRWVQRTSKPSRSPLDLSKSVSTFSTEACRGPSSHQRTISLTLSEGPSNKASTCPSGMFFTHPARPSSSAFCLVESLKKTPCTWPETLTCARSGSLLCTLRTSVGTLYGQLIPYLGKFTRYASLEQP